MHTVRATAGEGRLAVTCQLTTTGGKGIVAFVYGGEKPHVGGQALAAPGATIGGALLSNCDMWTATVPGHRDVEVAAVVARELCLTTKQAVSVTVGIHVDGAAEEDICVLVSNALAATKLAAQQTGHASN